MIDYRKIYRQYLGTKWDGKKYEVHHIDGNRENNDISNLVLLPRKLHQRFHKIQGVCNTYKDFFDIDSLHIFQYRTDLIDEYINIKEYIFWIYSNQVLAFNSYVPTKLFVDYLIKTEKEYDRKNQKI